MKILSREQAIFIAREVARSRNKMINASEINYESLDVAQDGSVYVAVSLCGYDELYHFIFNEHKQVLDRVE